MGSVFRVGRALIIGLSLDLAKKEGRTRMKKPRQNLEEAMHLLALARDQLINITLYERGTTLSRPDIHDMYKGYPTQDDFAVTQRFLEK